MIITCIYLAICFLSQDISINPDIFLPLIVVEGIVDIFWFMFRER